MKVIDGSRELVTQIYVQGEPANRRDFLLNAIRNEQSRQSLEVAFEASTDPTESELVARFDPVLGSAGDDEIGRDKKARIHPANDWSCTIGCPAVSRFCVALFGSDEFCTNRYPARTDCRNHV